MEVLYTKVLARKILVAFLAFTIILSITAFFVRNSISKKSENLYRLSNNIDSTQSKPEQILLLLYQAEDDFQESLADIDTAKSNNYKTKLAKALYEIEILLKENTDTTNLTIAQRTQIKTWYEKKIRLSDTLSELKHNFDSLLSFYAVYDFQVNDNWYSYHKDLQRAKRDSLNSSDTIRKADQRKGLIRRIKDAIANKDGKNVEIWHNKNVHERDLVTQKILSQNKLAYSKKIKDLEEQNLKLLNMQRELISLNTHIVNEMDRLVNEIKDINYHIAGEFKEMALKSYQDSTRLLNKLYLVALFLVLIFAILLMIFIYQLNKSELQLRSKIEKLNQTTTALATTNGWLQQALSLKRKLISIISHDLIGSIHSFNNTLKFISKTEVDIHQQKAVLYELSISSEQLAVYADDIITWIQFQQQDENIAIDIAPVGLYKLILEKWGMLAVRAKMKHIELDLRVDQNLLIKTDEKILGIIIYNILCNAVKYTENGKVTTSCVTKEDVVLLSFTDSGTGFPDDLIRTFNANQMHSISSKKGTKYELGKGMGLTIIKDLAKNISAQIIIGNNVAGGAFVLISFPL